MICEENQDTGKDFQSKLLKILNWAYGAAVNGLPGFDPAPKLAERYLHKSGKIQDNIISLIRWQISKTSTAGFLSGIGGLITLPFSFPINVASVILIQLRMVAAIAHMGDYDVTKEHVKVLTFTCLAGNQLINDLIQSLPYKIFNLQTPRRKHARMSVQFVQNDQKPSNATRAISFVNHAQLRMCFIQHT